MYQVVGVQAQTRVDQIEPSVEQLLDELLGIWFRRVAEGQVRGKPNASIVDNALNQSAQSFAICTFGVEAGAGRPISCSKDPPRGLCMTTLSSASAQ